MSGPQRIQRRRTKGWRLPEGAVCVDRSTPYGNPFLVRKWGQAMAVRLHREWLREPAQAELRERIRRELRGKDLVCWCPVTDEAGYPVPCHADELLRIANS